MDQALLPQDPRCADWERGAVGQSRRARRRVAGAVAVGLSLYTVAWAGASSADAAEAAAVGGAVGTLAAVPEMPAAPDFTLTDTKGDPHRLSAFRGRVVVVNFWSVWCAPCRREMPAMQRAWEQLRDQQVLILAVNFQDKAEQVAQFFSAIPVSFPVLLGGDQAMLKEWSVQGLPTTYVIDPQGRLRYRVVGEYHWDQAAALETLLALRKSVAGSPR